MPLGCSIRVPSLNRIWLTVPELERLQFSIDRQLSPNFYVFLGKKGHISNLIFVTPKGTTFAETTHNDVFSVGMCPKMRPVGVAKKRKKDRNFHASNWLFAHTTHVDIGPWNCSGNSYIFQVSWKSVEWSPSCGGSKIALYHWLCPWLIQQLILFIHYAEAAQS